MSEGIDVKLYVGLDLIGRLSCPKHRKNYIKERKRLRKLCLKSFGFVLIKAPFSYRSLHIAFCSKTKNVTVETKIKNNITVL